MSWMDIRDNLGLSCHPSHIRDILASRGYHKCIPRRKWGIRVENQLKRVKWCQDRLGWGYDEWLRTVLCDESYFSTAGFGSRPPVIRNAAEEYHPDCLDEVWESGSTGVMAWAAFCGHLKSDLVFVDGKVTINSEVYSTQILDPHLIPFWHKTCEEYGWTQVVEDGAPGHQKHAIKLRLKNDVEVLSWCPQSPDLNLIEALWRDMESYLGKKYGRIADLNALKHAVKEAWDQVGSERLEELIKSMPDPLRAVIAANGGATRY